MSLTQASGTSVAGTWTYTYGTTLGVTSVTDLDDHTTHYSYDTSGNLTSATDATTATTKATYNGFDEPLSISDPMGITTTFAYDTHGNLLSKTVTGTGGAPVETTSYVYGGPFAGEISKVTDPAGHTTTYSYDTYGDVASVTTHPSSGINDTTAYTYDALGRKVCEASPDATAVGVACPAAGQPRVAETTTWTYDADNEVTATTDPLGHTTTYTYDADGNTTQVSDPAGNVTKTTYDADNRKASVTQGAGTSSAATTGYGYDLAPGTGSCSSSVATYCTTTTDPNGLVTTDSFNARNELVETSQPNAGATTNTYDPAGNLATQTTPGGTATYGYDADNRQTSITYTNPQPGFAAAPNVTYGYDADGRRTQMKDGTGTTTYTYDALERLSATTNGAGSTVSYDYDADNEVTSITYPGGDTVTQSYDGAGRETSVADWLGHTTNFSYDADGNLTTEGYPNSTTGTYVYDASDQVTSITAKSGSKTLASFSYTRNADGLVATETDTGVPAPTSQTYSYDPLTRLGSTSTGSYSYDPASDLTKLASGASLSYHSGTEELSSLTMGSTTTAYGDNTQGDRTTAAIDGQSTTYSYDQAGRLVGFTPAPTKPTALAGGYSFSVALRSDGTVWSWGSNTYGQLGDGTTTSSSVPVEVSGIPRAVAVAAGSYQTLALKPDGTVWAWGDNGDGQLGDGTTTSSSVPVEVKNLTGVVAIAGGGFQSLALESNGTVWAWGDNAYGQLGDGSTKNSDVPVEVKNISGVTAIAGGWYHSLALESNGTVWDWGFNTFGELGNGSTKGSDVPVEAKGISTATAIAGGGYHSLALLSDGTVWAWGDNLYDELGNGSGETTSSVPVQVSTISAVTDISGGAYHSVAVESNGTVWAWGGNTYGQLGNGTTTKSNVPVQVENLSGASVAAAGAFHSLAVKSDGTLWAWGLDSSGQLGNGTTTNASVPVAVSGLRLSVHASYAYNGDGVRMSKTVGGLVEAATWDTNTSTGVPALLVDGTHDYVYGPGGLPLEQVHGTSVVYYVHDQIGSTRLLTSSSGSTVATYTYGPYGALASSTGSQTNPFGFAGGYQDTESGLLYLSNRYYDPTTGQFLSVDPAVTVTQGPYSYANDDPVNEADPLGLWGWNPISDVTQAWNDTGGKVVHAVATHTIGICVNVSAGWGAYGTASGCVALSGGRFTLVGTAGGGGSSPTASATLGLLVSNASNPSDLRGPFAQAGGSVDLGLSAGDEGSIGNGSCGQTIWENQVTAGLGLDLPIPFEGHGVATYTWTWSP